jgi:hypothetical protein
VFSHDFVLPCGVVPVLPYDYAKIFMQIIQLISVADFMSLAGDGAGVVSIPAARRVVRYRTVFNNNNSHSFVLAQTLR